MRLVSVVTSVRSPFSACVLISAMRSSICPFAGRTSTWGPTRPVGRTICSTTCWLVCRSYSPGVADKDHLVDETVELFPRQRPDVVGVWEAEAEVRQVLVAGAGAL